MDRPGSSADRGEGDGPAAGLPEWERERLIKALAERKVGDAIVVGAMNNEGNVLSGVEVLKLATEEAPAPTAEEVARLKTRIVELEM